jgi:DMATS type aromatic prenyltransferase
MNYHWISEKTFGEFISEKIKSVCRVLNFKDEEINSTLKIFNLMAGSWKDLNIGTESRWFSDVTDDFTPFEFSLSLSHKQPILRFLSDNLSQPYTLESSWNIGCKLNEELERSFGACIARFQQIKHLFEPHNPQAFFAIWHAVDLELGRQPKFKLYLNPQCRGVKQASAIVEEALQRLGFTQAWNCISQFALQDEEQDQIKYFSLDLSHGTDARVKVYVVHKNATAKKLETVLAANPYHEYGEIIEFCRTITEQEGPFTTRPVISCFAFTTDNEMYPLSSTLHLPIRFYLNNDEIARQKISHILSPQNAAIHEQIISCIADRHLVDSSGIQTYCAFKRKKSKKSNTIYIAPETYKLISFNKLINKAVNNYQSQIAVSTANSFF